MPTSILLRRNRTRRRGGAEEASTPLMKGGTRCLGFGVLMCLLITLPVSPASAPHSYKPPCGYVPDQQVAIAIAEAVLSPIYGAKQISSERPFHAVLRGNVWEVSGSLPPGMDGGVAVIRIGKDDGRILQVTHGK